MILAGGIALSLNDWVSLVGLVLLLAGFVIAVPSRRSMKDWKDRAEMQQSRAGDLERDLAGAVERANAAQLELREQEKLVAHLQGEAKVRERYTAQGALETVAERMATLETAIVTAIQGNSTLTLETAATLKELHDTLDNLNRHMRGDS